MTSTGLINLTCHVLSRLTVMVDWSKSPSTTKDIISSLPERLWSLNLAGLCRTMRGTMMFAGGAERMYWEQMGNIKYVFRGWCFSVFVYFLPNILHLYRLICQSSVWFKCPSIIFASIFIFCRPQKRLRKPWNHVGW